MCLLPHCLTELIVGQNSGVRVVFRVETGWEVNVEIGVCDKKAEWKKKPYEYGNTA